MKLVAAICVLLMLTGLTACGEGEAPLAELTVVEAFMQDAEAVNRGQALFIGTCAGYCHKTTPEETDAVFLFDCQWIHGGSDQEIFDTVTNGVPNTRMVGFGSNFPEGEDDLWKIIAYLRINQQDCS
ncbi:MAG: c-type cytochrome [Gammaproteobacteria bacterium]|nr:c-type cytochrome [Gammaproteobacteria bacterium]